MRLFPVALFVLLLGMVFPHGLSHAVEICSDQGVRMMREAGMDSGKIRKMCDQHQSRKSPLSISYRRGEDELGYCRVTLSLENRTSEYLNQLTLTSVGGQFEIFRFHNILPGTTGYATAKSRELLSCDEARELRLGFHWPVSIRIGDKNPQGKRLEYYRPGFADSILYWTP